MGKVLEGATYRYLAPDEIMQVGDEAREDRHREWWVIRGLAGSPVSQVCGDDVQVRRKISAESRPAPTVVCLCGSTRFFKEFMLANYQETMAGHIVLSVGFYPHASEEAHGQQIGISAADKERLDELHKRKIDLADELLVINVGGYIGDSTRGEIEYAKDHGKPVRYWEPHSVV